MLRWLAALLLAAPVFYSPGLAAGTEAPSWKFQNPFCEVVAGVEASSDGSEYAVALFSGRGTTLAAHVTLVTAANAYDVHVPAGNLSGPPEDRASEGVAVKLPAGERVKYYFVDSYAVDGGSDVTCPSYVFPVGDHVADIPNGVQPIAATLLQSLGKLPCGNVYRPADVGRDPGGVIGHFGDRPLSTKYHVFVNSNGHAVEATLVSSSGVEGVDAAALGSVEQAEYEPAQFLCTPVVGELVVRMDYVP